MKFHVHCAKSTKVYLQIMFISASLILLASLQVCKVFGSPIPVGLENSAQSADSPTELSTGDNQPRRVSGSKEKHDNGTKAGGPLVQPPEPPGPAGPPGDTRPVIDASTQFGKLVDSFSASNDRNDRPHNANDRNRTSLAGAATRKQITTVTNPKVENGTLEGTKSGSISNGITVHSQPFSVTGGNSTFPGGNQTGPQVNSNSKTVGRSRCTFPMPSLDTKPKCTFEVINGSTLNIFQIANMRVSICETMTENFQQCQTMCENVRECRAVHFCNGCVEHNCRLLNEPRNGPSKLGLITRYEYVDYAEKGACAL